MKIKHKTDPVLNRQREYSPIGDQLDLLYKGFQEDIAAGKELSPSHKEWVASIKAIKDKYPKKSS